MYVEKLKELLLRLWSGVAEVMLKYMPVHGIENILLGFLTFILNF